MFVMALVLILARSEDWGSGSCRVVKGNSFELVDCSSCVICSN